jgi:hypothetical protein
MIFHIPAKNKTEQIPSIAFKPTCGTKTANTANTKAKIKLLK